MLFINLSIILLVLLRLGATCIIPKRNSTLVSLLTEVPPHVRNTETRVPN